MRRLLVLLTLLLLTLACGPASAQDGTGVMRVGVTILEPLSSDGASAPTMQQVRNGVDVTLPAQTRVDPFVFVTVERDGQVQSCPPRRGSSALDRDPPARCPLPRQAAGGEARVRMLIVPVT